MKARADIPVHQLPEASFLAFDQSATFGEHMPHHRIDFYALVWFLETRGLHYVDFEPFPIRRDVVFLLAKNQVHSIPSVRLPRSRVIVFSADFFQRIEEPYLRLLFLPFGKDGIRIPPAMTGPMKALFDLILLEVNDRADPVLLLKYFTAFLLHLHRFSKVKQPAAAAEDKRMVRLFQLLQQHYKEERNAAFYAGKIGLTPKRINEILRERMGTTISQLLYHLLLIEAKRELLMKKQSIKEIAYALGFSEQSYFARFFKKQTGTTPEQFRATAAHTFGG